MQLVESCFPLWMDLFSQSAYPKYPRLSKCHHIVNALELTYAGCPPKSTHFRQCKELSEQPQRRKVLSRWRSSLSIRLLSRQPPFPPITPWTHEALGKSSFCSPATVMRGSFLACQDLGRMFDNSFPSLRFLFIF